MSDENLQELIRDGNYEKVVIAARRAKKLSVIKDLKLMLSTTEISYLYRLRFNGGPNKRIYFYSQTLDQLVQFLIDEVDKPDTRVSLPELGFHSSGSSTSLYEFTHGKALEHIWKLSKVPMIQISGGNVILGQSPATPYFKIADVSKILEEAGHKSKRLSDCNQAALNARAIASADQSNRDREQYVKQLRKNRLEVFKEALTISKEAAIKYRDAIKDDPEFTRVTQILLDRAK